MAGFYSARSSIMPPLPWPTFAPPLSQVKYLEGGYPDAKTALDDAAKQISSATGLEIAH